MDKYNIISPTADINELEKDMFNWCMLPYEVRMQSIDDCRRLYNGMSVTDLYHTLKEMILKQKDLMNIDQDNIVRESVATEYDKYDELLAQSKELQQSPYIVILDPDIIDLEELNNKYYSYCCLNDNNQQLSDTYSWKIWGRNVYSMYFALLADISKESKNETDDSNIIPAFESTNIANRIEDSIEPFYNLFNEALYDNDIITMYKLNKNIRSSQNNTHSMLENMIIIKRGVCKELPFDKTILPKVTPWFTPAEQPRIKHFDTDKFYSLLKAKLAEKDEEEKEKQCLDIGWNPALDKYDNYARDRQASFLNNIDIINLKNFNIGQKQIICSGSELKPLFFIFGYDKPVQYRIPEYNKIGISLPNSIGKVYCFDGVDNTFNGIIKSSIYDFKYVDIITIFVNKNIVESLKYKLEDENTLRIIGKKDVNSVYSILSNTTNKLSQDNLRIIYSRYINLICQVLNIEDNEYFDKYRLNSKINLFKVYSGEAKQITKSVVNSIFNKLIILLDNYHRTHTLTKLVGEDCGELSDRMKPKSSIVKR